MMSELLNAYNDLKKINCLSVATRIGNLVMMLPLFNSTIHSTMMPMLQKEEYPMKIPQAGFKELVGDFFELSRSEEMDAVNVVLSHETIHCMDDSRYQNQGGLGRPYRFANKLVRICPHVEHAIVSVPVRKEENIVDGCTILANEKFIASFIEEGFQLKSAVYDKFRSRCVYESRLEYELPKDCEKEGMNIVGTFHFIRNV